MENINKNTRIKILLLFILSNISTYLLSSSDVDSYEETTTISSSTQLRKDYVKIQLNAELLVNYVPNTPISILNSKNKLIIPHGILIEVSKSANENQLINESETFDYIVYIPTKYMSNVLKEKRFKIVPFGSITNNKSERRRRGYEFSY